MEQTLSSIPVKKKNKFVPFFPGNILFYFPHPKKPSQKIILFRINIPGITAFLCDGLIITLKSYYFFSQTKKVSQKNRKRDNIMILSDKTILTKMESGEIEITPKPSTEQIQPASIDLKLGNEFLMQHPDTPIDIKNGSPHYETIQCNVLQLPPNAFVLGTTIEKVRLPPNLIGRVEGRSSIGRLGVAIHVTAGFIDCGFEGQITLEIKNLSHNTVMLYENMRIAQIVFEEVDNTPNRVYG